VLACNYKPSLLSTVADKRQYGGTHDDILTRLELVAVVTCAFLASKVLTVMSVLTGTGASSSSSSNIFVYFNSLSERKLNKMRQYEKFKK